jgi:hypothetical protein
MCALATLLHAYKMTAYYVVRQDVQRCSNARSTARQPRSARERPRVARPAGVDAERPCHGRSGAALSRHSCSSPRTYNHRSGWNATAGRRCQTGNRSFPRSVICIRRPDIQIANWSAGETPSTRPARADVPLAEPRTPRDDSRASAGMRGGRPCVSEYGGPGPRSDGVLRATRCCPRCMQRPAGALHVGGGSATYAGTTPRCPAAPARGQVATTLGARRRRCTRRTRSAGGAAFVRISDGLAGIRPSDGPTWQHQVPGRRQASCCVGGNVCSRDPAWSVL